MNYEEAIKQADKFKNILMPLCDKVEIAGSIRRKKQADIKDVELVCIPSGSKLFKWKEAIERWRKIKGSPLGKYTQRVSDGIVLDIFIANEINFGLIFMIRTGSSDFSRRMMTECKVKGYYVKDGYLWRTMNNEKIKTPEEKDFFEITGLPFIEPEKRTE